jgi:hypothetical protein
MFVYLLFALSQISHDMCQPLHALSMLNSCLHDALAAHERRLGSAASPELESCFADSRQMRDVLKHLMSLADDFLVWSSLKYATQTNTNIHTHTHTHTHTCARAHKNQYQHTDTHIDRHTLLHACTHIYTHTVSHTHTHTHTYTHTHTHTYTHTHTHTHSSSATFSLKLERTALSAICKRVEMVQTPL